MKALRTARFVRCTGVSFATALRRWAALTLFLVVCPPASAQQPEPNLDFSTSILPIFHRHCVRCHGPGTQKAGLRLDSKAELMRGGDSGKVVVPRDVSASALLMRLTTKDKDLRMPFGKPPLAQEQIELIRRWIEQGAPGQDAAGTAAARSDHWSFQPLRHPDVPPIKQAAWARNPIDHFILARLEKEGIAPSPEADRQTLIRRLSLDLTGLPPTPQETAAFVADPRPDAYERLVDRLLASPHFGERFAGHWLDLARYGDSDGFEQDAQRPNAYRWRDWVIAAINADMPFDQFTIEQLAGDLLPGATPQQLLATGFHRNAPTNREGGIDKEEARVRMVVDRVNTTGTVWLGLTVGCAECHSHKFDPLRQSEFYQLYAFFNDAVDEADVPLPPTSADLERYEREKAVHAERLQSLREMIAKASPEQKAALELSLNRLQKRVPSPPQPFLPAFRAAANARQTHVHKGGDYRQQGALVQPGTPAVLPPLKARNGPGQPADRLDLARWLVAPDNPLTARVEANRVWQYLFGAGIVTTPDDFGVQGDPPTHPQLLDHLASQLISQGWSRKALIRHIVTSSTYRQSSRHRPELEAIDPANRLLARQNRFRLPAEIVRDVYLDVAGLLYRRVGGPGMRPEIPPGFDEFGYRFNWIADPAPERYRRGMYIFFQRNMVLPLLRTFDRSDTNVTCVHRERSNTPLQALTQLNDPEFVKAAVALGLRILREAPASQGARIEYAFRLCYGRSPTTPERDLVTQLWDELQGHYRKHTRAAADLVGSSDGLPAPQADTAAWVAVARVLMNTDEFITRE